MFLAVEFDCGEAMVLVVAPGARLVEAPGAVADGIIAVALQGKLMGGRRVAEKIQVC